MSQVITSSLLLPHEFKNIDTKKRILNILKVAHENFTWSGRKIPHIGRHDGHRWDGFWLKVLDAQAAFPLSTEFRLARLFLSKHKLSTGTVKTYMTTY